MICKLLYTFDSSEVWTLRINDTQKDKVLYTWDWYDAIINFHLGTKFYFLRIINSKQPALSNYYNSY